MNFRKKLILPTILFSLSIDGYSQEMPTGGNVQSGTATISGYGTNELRIDQKSQNPQNLRRHPNPSESAHMCPNAT